MRGITRQVCGKVERGNSKDYFKLTCDRVGGASVSCSIHTFFSIRGNFLLGVEECPHKVGGFLPAVPTLRSYL